MWTLHALARKIRSALRALLFRGAAERDLDDEIRLHIELETARHLRNGVDAVEARRLALVAFGGVEVVKEAHRDGRGSRWIEELLSDTRLALRALRRSPTHAITAIATLGLGIGATTAIVAVVNQVIVRPLPFAKPDRLVMMWEENPDRGWKLNVLSPANYLDMKERVGAFENAGGWLDFQNDVTLTGEGEPRRLRSVLVTGGLFSTLGVKPALGRIFREEETWNTGTRNVMMSHRLWRDQFGARPDMVGRFLELDGDRYEVVGILPPSFRIPGLDADLWTPTAFPTANRQRVFFRRAHYMRGVARLKPGVSVERAHAEVQAVMHQLEKDYPETNTHMGGGVTPLHTFLVGDTRRPLLLLLSAVAVLLLIACVNVGNLLLVQSAARQREVALRLALGAGKGRLVRQSLTESVVLAIVGGIAGVGLGWIGVRALAALEPHGMLPSGAIVLEWTTVSFVLAVAAVAGLLFGVAPALWQSRRSPGDMLKEGGRTGSGGRRMQRWAGTLVVTEVALAVMLTLGAGLLVRSYWLLEQVDPGFRGDGVMTMSLTLPSATYDSARKVTAFQEALMGRARALPGVQSVALVSNLPSTAASWSSDFIVEGQAGEAAVTDVVHREASPAYQQVMGIKLVRGRLFTDADRDGAPMVVLINDMLARRFFPNQDPVGKRIAFDRVASPTSTWRTIVGVVGSERQGKLASDARPEFIAPLAQDIRTSTVLVVRSSGEPSSLAAPLRRTVSELDARLAISSMLSMTEVARESVGRERFLTTILFVFAAVGLLLALVGVYGVMSQLVRGRTREMGIRLALGAPHARIQWFVVQRGLLLTGTGIGIGVAVASIGARALSALLFGVQPLDAVTFLTVPLLLGAATTIASWLPARTASRVDPTVTLRAE